MNFTDPAAEKVLKDADAYARERLAHVGKTWTREQIKRELVTAVAHGYCMGMRATSATVREVFADNAPAVREAPAAYLANANPFDPLEKRPSSRLSLPPPSPLEILRAAKPSRELVGLLANLSTEHARVGKTDDAVALLILGLCVNEVVPRE